MHTELPEKPLLHDVAGGKESAWRDIVERYSPLVLAVCRGYGLSGADAEDVAGSVWLRLVTAFRGIREPGALPGWLRTTARNECRMLLRHRNRQIPTDAVLIEDAVDGAADLDAGLIGAERRAAVRAAVGQLPERDLALLSLLFSDPPTPYREISSTLGIPIGAIGPTRARCLARARVTPAVAALLAERPRDHGPTRSGIPVQKHRAAG